MGVAIALGLAAVLPVPWLGRLAGAFPPADGEPVRRPVPPTPVLAAVTAAAVGAVTWALRDHPGWLPAYLYLTLAGVVLAVVDLRVHRLPDAIVLPSYPVLVALFGLAALVDGDGHGNASAGRLGRALAAGVALYLFFALAHSLARGGLGRGDVKLAGLLGIALGWLGVAQVLVGLLLGTLSAGLLAVVRLATGRATRTCRLAYGPHLLLGTLLAVVAG
ncbi:MAG: prepilin peptidase [Frankia sp.]|nr:prepilin peptidase [Frankia sp.]